MSKEKEETIDNPFKNFNLLNTPEPAKAEPVKTDKDEQGTEGKATDSKKTSGNQENEEVETDAEAERRLAEVAAKQAKAADKAKKKEIVEEEESEEEVEDTTQEQEVEEDNSLKAVLETWNEKGVLTIDFEDEDFKDANFKDEAIVEKAISKTIEKGINDWKNSYPEETKAFLEFVENGGNPKQFLDAYYGNQSWEGFKPENEAAQKAVIREGLKLAGWEDSEIEDEIQLYEDSNKLEAKANQHLTKLQKAEAEFKKELVKQQEERRKQHETSAKEYYDNLHKTWYNKEDLNGFKLNKTTKDKVWDFIYKVDKKSGKTGLQESYENNIDAQFMYAYLAMNNFDISKLEKIVESKVTSKVRKTLSNYTDQRFKTTRGQSEREGKVEDNGSVGFEGFKRIV